VTFFDWLRTENLSLPWDPPIDWSDIFARWLSGEEWEEAELRLYGRCGEDLGTCEMEPAHNGVATAVFYAPEKGVHIDHLLLTLANGRYVAQLPGRGLCLCDGDRVEIDIGEAA